MLAEIEKLIPDLDYFEEAELLDARKKRIGWHAQSILRDGTTLGGGSHPVKETAMRIAISESIERRVFSQIARSYLNPVFLLDTYASSCGFACGFERNATLFRAICEAVERWAWSQWIDRGKEMEELSSEPGVSEFASYFKSPFRKVLYFKKTLRFEDVLFGKLNLQLGVTLGLSDKGVFPGSRVTSVQDEPWTHALVESWRHWQIFNSRRSDAKRNENVFYDRIRYFGSHADKALSQINKCDDPRWEQPKLMFLKEAPVQQASYFLFRALCEGFLGWDRGDRTRFVY